MCWKGAVCMLLQTTHMCCKLRLFFFFKDVGSWAVVFISFFINCLSMQSLLPVLCFIFSVTLFKKKKKTQGMYHNQTDIRTVQISFLQGVCESWVFFEGKVEAFLEVVLLIIKSFFPPWFFLSYLLLLLLWYWSVDDDYASGFHWYFWEEIWIIVVAEKVIL